MVLHITDNLIKASPHRNARVIIQPDVNACADPYTTRVLLENLLGNAWKFTAREAEAVIEFGVHEDRREPVYLVCDNGAGFDMAYAEKLFTPFQRLHSDADYPGTGIGLATVQRIVELTAATSGPMASRAAERASISNPVLSRRFSTSMILLVEDNEDEIDLARRAFQRASPGVPLEVARDGAQALAFLFEVTERAKSDPSATRRASFCSI